MNNLAYMNKTVAIKGELKDLRDEIGRLALLGEGAIGMCGMSIAEIKNWFSRTQKELRSHLGLDVCEERHPASTIPTAAPFAQFRYEGEIVSLTEWQFTQALVGDCDCGKCLACRAKEYSKENE